MVLCRVLLLACTIVCVADTSDKSNDGTKELPSSIQDTCRKAFQQDFDLLNKRMEHDRIQFLERLNNLESQQHMMQTQLASLVASRFDENGTPRTRRQFAEQTEVVFFASVGPTLEHLGMDQVIVFDRAVTNVDSTNSLGGYSATTGVFTAPMDGMYVFHCTIMAHETHVFHAVIYKNTTALADIRLGGGIWYITASNSAIVAMRKGEQVMVRHKSTDHSIEGSSYGGQSTFAGFLLSQHFIFNPNPVVG